MTSRDTIGPDRSIPAANRFLLIAVVLVVTVAGYLPLLGWHHLQQYQTGKVWTFVGVLAVLAAWSGWRGRVAFGALVQASFLTVLWSVDATTDSSTGDDGMWGAGALFVLIGTFGGAFVIATTTDLIRTIRHKRR